MPIAPIETTLSESELFTQPKPVASRPIYRSGSTSYNPEDYGIGYEEVFDFPAGKYFIGDPSFVDDSIDIVAGEYEEHDVEGIGTYVCFPVPSAGGVYLDEEEHPHECPCGSLGVIPIGHLTKGHWAALREVGRIVDFDDEFQVQLDSHGNIFLGWNWIFTGYEDAPDAINGKA
jgi:hypothetical protein